MLGLEDVECVEAGTPNVVVAHERILSRVGAGGESPKRVRIGWPKLGSIPTAPEALEPEDVSRAREARRVGSSTGVATAERALDRHGDNGRVSAFGDVRRLPLKPIWDGIAARVVSGERLSFGVVELIPAPSCRSTCTSTSSSAWSSAARCAFGSATRRAISAPARRGRFRQTFAMKRLPVPKAPS